MRRIYINEDLCMGCGLCQVFCTTEHSSSKNVIKAYKKEIPTPIARLRVERKGEVSLSLQCRQCDQPWCVYSCLTGALQKDPTSGVVTVDHNKCMGCWTCLLSCPSGGIIRDKDRNVAAKCDFCPGREVPACVANCPNEALMVVEEGEPEKIRASNGPLK